jgi:small subunit ribosomal protein S6
MRSYETVFILSTDLSEEEQSALLDRFRELVANNGGEIVEECVWGRRRLAYPIQKKEFGLYLIWYINGTGATLDELHRQLGYTEQILRYQSIRVESIADEVSAFRELIKEPADSASEADGESPQEDTEKGSKEEGSKEEASEESVA